ncbi:MAG: DUF1016 family protein [Bacteroidales bacterium]|nr:DUF1016 family protein [Bacteroidales bacterium]
MKQEELQNSLFNDACVIIEQARTVAYKSVDEILIKRNWLLGMRIQHEVLKDKRAEYGEQVIKKLAKDLSEKYGSGYSRNNLYRYISFYKSFGGIFEMKSEGLEIVPSVMGQSQIVPSLMGLSYETNLYDLIKPIKPIRLSWTHYSIILQESDAGARIWYENEAANEMWSTRTLQRNISSQYYHRLLKSQNQDVVREEMKQKTSLMQDKLEFIKNPVIAEFLGFKNNPDYTENTLEKGIIDHLVPFLMELGKGFAFVDRQKHIHTEKQDYYIDLVFYNYHLQCFVLIDLKTTKLNYQDVGQMDMYVKMYDELVRPNGHNPTIGILLCADTDEDVAHYSVLNGNDQLYATRYLTFMPTKEELRREIERQKEIFMLQHQVSK